MFGNNFYGGAYVPIEPRKIDPVKLTITFINKNNAPVVIDHVYSYGVYRGVYNIETEHKSYSYPVKHILSIEAENE